MADEPLTIGEKVILRAGGRNLFGVLRDIIPAGDSIGAWGLPQMRGFFAGSRLKPITLHARYIVECGQYHYVRRREELSNLECRPAEMLPESPRRWLREGPAQGPSGMVL